jgi:hypothetical protein
MRGGKREGAGRPSGAKNIATAELKLSLSELARAYTEDALSALFEVARYGRSEQARVSAAIAILDRAYGKPALYAQQSLPNDLPPIVIQRAE